MLKIRGRYKVFMYLHKYLKIININKRKGLEGSFTFSTQFGLVPGETIFRPTLVLSLPPPQYSYHLSPHSLIPFPYPSPSSFPPPSPFPTPPHPLPRELNQISSYKEIYWQKIYLSSCSLQKSKRYSSSRVMIQGIPQSMELQR